MTPEEFALFRCKVNESSLHYLKGKPDSRSDVIKFKDRLISDKVAAKTSMAYLAPIFGFLEENHFAFTSRFKKGSIREGE